MAVKSWKLSGWLDKPRNWNLTNFKDQNPQPMTEEEIEAGIKFLRDGNYPKPDDCPQSSCPEYRPACQLGICKIAVCLCGDW